MTYCYHILYLVLRTLYPFFFTPYTPKIVVLSSLRVKPAHMGAVSFHATVPLKWALSLCWWFVIQVKRCVVCVCVSSLQCPAPVDPTVCPRHRGGAAAAVCVWRPLCTLGPRAKLSLVSGFRAGQDFWLLENQRNKVTLGKIFLGEYMHHISRNLKRWRSLPL